MDYSVNVRYDAQMSLKGLNDSDIIFSMLHCIVRNNSESVDGRLCFDEIKWKNIFILKMQVDNLKF